MEYILKLKTLTNSLATIKEPVFEQNQILELLGGLGPNYNLIVAFLTAWEDDTNLHSIHNFQLTHEQRLHFQNTVTKDEIISTNIATQSHFVSPRKH